MCLHRWNELSSRHSCRRYTHQCRCRSNERKKKEEEEETLKQTQLSQVDLCLIIRMTDSALTYKLAVSALQPTKTKYYSLTTYQLHPVRAIKIWSYEGGDRTGRS